MNRNTLFRQSLLSTAIVAVLQGYTPVVSAAPCENIEDDTLYVAAEETCDAVTSTAENPMASVVVKGVINGDVINEADQDHFAIQTDFEEPPGPEPEGGPLMIENNMPLIAGRVVNNGDLLGDGGFGVVGSDETLRVDGSITNNGSAYTLYAENVSVGGDVTNSGTLTDDWIYVYESMVSGSVVNAGVMGSEDNPVYDGIYVADSDIGKDVRNDGTFFGDNEGIYILESAIGGTVENSGNITIYTQGDDYEEDGLFGIRVDEYTDISGSVINSGTITIAEKDPAEPSGLTDGAGGIFVGSYEGIDFEQIEEDPIVAYVEGDVINTGTINVSVQSDIEGSTFGIGINGAEVAGRVGNVGKDSVINSAREGILVEGFSEVGDIVNEGTINVSEAWEGIYADYAYVNNSINNSGTINTTRGSGIGLEPAIVGSIINSGEITARGGEWDNFDEGYIDGHGIYVGSTDYYYDDREEEDRDELEVHGSRVGSITNSGRIAADDDGIHIGWGSYVTGELPMNGEELTYSGDITNTGTITAGGVAIRVYGTVEGTLRNSGDLLGGLIDPEVAEGERIAIDYREAESALSIVQTDGLILGDIYGSQWFMPRLAVEPLTDTIEFAGGVMEGTIWNVEDIQITGDFTLFGSVLGFDSLTTITDSGTLRMSGHREFDGDLQVDGALALTINNATDTATPLMEVYGEIVLNEGSQLLINPEADNYDASLDGIRYVALQGDSLVDGGVSVGSESVLIKAELGDITEDSLNVVVTANDLVVIAETGGADDNVVNVIRAYQQAALGALDENDPLWQALSGATTPEEIVAIAESMLADTGSVVASSRAAQNETLGAIFKRIASFRSGASGIGAGDVVEPGSLWLQGIYSEGDQDAVTYKGNQFDGYGLRTRGFTLGGDADFSDTLTAGLAVTYGTTTSNTDNSRDGSETDSYLLSAYASWRQQDYFVDGSVAVGVSRADVEQYTGNQRSTADYDANQYAVRLVAGRDYTFDNSDTLVEPQVAFNYSRVDTDSYTLRPLDMRVSGQRLEAIELGAGVRLMTGIDTGKGVLIPELNLMAWHDFAADRGDTSARFLAGGDSFVSVGARPQQTNYQAGLGMQYWMDSNISLSLNYDRSWNSDFDADTWLANVRYDF